MGTQNIPDIQGQHISTLCCLSAQDMYRDLQEYLKANQYIVMGSWYSHEDSEQLTNKAY